MTEPIVYPDGVWCLQVDSPNGPAVVMMPMVGEDVDVFGVHTFFSSNRAEAMAPKCKGLPGPAVPIRLELADFLAWLDQLDPAVRYVVIDYVIGEPVCRRCPIEKFRERLAVQAV
jgi:hypothetical protein